MSAGLILCYEMVEAYRASSEADGCLSPVEKSRMRVDMFFRERKLIRPAISLPGQGNLLSSDIRGRCCSCWAIFTCGWLSSHRVDQHHLACHLTGNALLPRASHWQVGVLDSPATSTPTKRSGWICVSVTVNGTSWPNPEKEAPRHPRQPQLFSAQSERLAKLSVRSAARIRRQEKVSAFSFVLSDLTLSFGTRSPWAGADKGSHLSVLHSVRASTLYMQPAVNPTPLRRPCLIDLEFGRHQESCDAVASTF